MVQRQLDSQKFKNANKPLFVSTLAATGVPKLKIMLTEESSFLRTLINVAQVREDLFKNQSEVRTLGQRGASIGTKKDSVPQTIAEDKEVRRSSAAS